MLSSEVMTTLGGRYMSMEVYPYSFAEYLKAEAIPYDEISLLATESRATVLRTWNEYLCWGGLPESVGLTVKRTYLSSTFQKIYLGDISNRNKISNPLLLRLLLKKLAESVCLLPLNPYQGFPQWACYCLILTALFTLLYFLSLLILNPGAKTMLQRICRWSSMTTTIKRGEKFGG